jgi:Predicted NADH:ubiquinone oxidoreductase, subunit RnfG
MANNKTLLLKSGWVLGLFSLIGIGLVSLTYSITKDKIADNQRYVYFTKPSRTGARNTS